MGGRSKNKGRSGTDRITAGRTDGHRSLEENERFLQEVFDGIRDGISILDRGFRIVRVNAWMEKRYARFMPLVGRKCHEVYQGRDTPCENCPCARALETGEAQTDIVPYPRAVGRSGWIELSGFPLTDETGRVTGIIEHVKDVTERVKTEETIKEREAWFRSIVQNLSEVVWIFDGEGVFQYETPSCPSILGYAPGFLLGKCGFDFVHPDDVEGLRETHERMVRTREPFISREFRFRHAEGHWVPLDAVANNLMDHQGIRGIVVTARDVTERRRAEKAIQQSEASLLSIFRAAPVGIGLVSDRILLAVNDRLCEMMGCFMEELIGKSARILYPDEEEFDRVGREKYGQIARCGTGTVETRWRRKNGVVIDVLLSSAPLDPTNLSSGVTFTALDITERKRAEVALQRSAKRYRELYESSRDGYAMTTMDGTIVESNTPFQEMLGYTAEELRKLTYQDITPPRWHGEEARVLEEQVYRRGYSDVYEKEYLRKDGTVFPIEIRTYLLRDERNAPTRMWAFVRDITARKKEREALRLTQFSVDHTGDGAFWIGPDARLLYVNDTACRTLGYTREELLNMTVHDVDPGFPKSVWPDHWAELKRHGSLTFESRHRKKDGTVIPVEITARYLLFDGREYNFAFVRDISERKRAEEKDQQRRQQLIQADRMISLGILVSGVAHEINNPNHFIMSHAAMLRNVWTSVKPILDAYFRENGDFAVAGMNYSEVRDKIPGMFSSLKEGSTRIKTIVDELREFAREKPSEMTDLVQINRIVSSTITLLTNMLKKHTRKFSVRYGENLPNLKGNYQRLEQVVINLIQNALQAIPDPDRGVSVVTRYDREAGAIVLEVKDEGVGIPPEDLDRITDPFFTTKRDSGGTGLGLSISSSIVMEHRGTLTFHSEPGMGTTAVVALPVEGGGVLAVRKGRDGKAGR